MNTVFYFASDAFKPTTGELDDTHDDYINPGVFALGLADFLVEKLNSAGYSMTFRCQEDWGHWIELGHDGGFKLAVGCSNMAAEDSAMTYHRIFVVPNRPYVRKVFKKIDVTETVDRLEDDIHRILKTEPSISDLTTEAGG